MTASDLPSETIQTSRDNVNGVSGPLRYPAEHGRYYTVIQFVRYNRTNPKQRAIRLNQADIVLPLPSNLREYYAIQYGDVEFDKLGGALSTADKVINEYLSTGGFHDALSEVGAAGVEFAQAQSRVAANFFSNDLGGLIDRVTGTVVNPHITSVFRGVGLREHNLSWKLHARTPAESATIKSIVDFIRDRMHASKKSDFLLNFPDEVYVKFFAEDKDFLYPIFKAVVTSVVADPSSEGTNAFFKGTDRPVVVTLDLSLKEVEAATREDFATVADSAAGAETPTTDSGTDISNGASGVA